MKTTHILMLQYDGTAIIPARNLAEDYFDLSEAKFVQKCRAGDIALPLIKLDSSSQKGRVGVHVQDVADFLDRCREEARADLRKLQA